MGGLICKCRGLNAGVGVNVQVYRGSPQFPTRAAPNIYVYKSRNKKCIRAFETPDKTYPIKLDNGEKLSSLAQFDINIFGPIPAAGSTTLTPVVFSQKETTISVFMCVFEPSQRRLDP